MKLSSTGYLVREGFRNIWANRMMSLASVIVLVSCLIITGSAALISVNVNSLIASIGDDDQITVYLLPDLSDTDSVKLESKLLAIDNIAGVHFRSREDVLKDYKKTLGDDIYSAMQGDGNPFGNEYKVRLDDLSLYADTVAEIGKLPGERCLLLEFVRGDDPAQLERDAACLKRWMKGDWT